MSSKKENVVEPTNTISASHRIIYDPSSSSDSDISSDEEESFDAAQYWIVDINNIVNALQNVCVCIKCHDNLELVELVNFRAGLGTKFSLRCLNLNCDIEESFYSTDKTNRVYDVNKKSVLASRVIGKGSTGLLKLCSVLGLSSPVAKSRFTEHLKVFEEKAFMLHDENLKKAASRARDLTIREQNLAHSAEIVGIPTSFDGTWFFGGWTPSRDVVTAIAEI